jgi:hypothetical protein
LLFFRCFAGFEAASSLVRRMSNPDDTKAKAASTSVNVASNGNVVITAGQQHPVPLATAETTEQTDPFNDFPFCNRPEESDADATAGDKARAAEAERLKKIQQNWNDKWKDTLAAYLQSGGAATALTAEVAANSPAVVENTTGVGNTTVTSADDVHM